MREYLKDMNKRRKFKDFVRKQKDFRYIEDKNNAIFYPEKAHYKEGWKIGIKLSIAGNLRIGVINPHCDNFQFEHIGLKEFGWLRTMIVMVEKYNKEALK